MDCSQAQKPHRHPWCRGGQGAHRGPPQAASGCMAALAATEWLSLQKTGCHDARRGRAPPLASVRGLAFCQGGGLLSLPTANVNEYRDQEATNTGMEVRYVAQDAGTSVAMDGYRLATCCKGTASASNDRARDSLDMGPAHQHYRFGT
jgi:hypothetical protein